jgi:adenylate kinase
MDKGAYVPDDVTIKMVMEWMDSPDHREGFVLDGFPRTEAQAEALDRELDPKGGLDKVVYIRVSQEELTKRLSGRLLCRRCQTPYQSENTPPTRPGVCDRCGDELFQRDDDKPDVVAKRIQVFTEETEPVVQYYRQTGRLAEIDGETTIEEVGKALLAALD